ncbi:MAG: carbon monoxide dehydrogenase [Candidatus Aramenus sp.]|jgi:carbon monoxide dehydrogenase subunit G|nr:carbon monoxide dehydrogenase [Candidatus Aramenus sp.]
MRFQGAVEVKASKAQIMETLKNLEAVATCFPGIKEVKKDGEEYKVVGTAGIGFVKGEYKATVKFTKSTEDGFDLSAKGTGMNSNVDILAQVKVSEGKIEYDADVKVSGVLASVGSRLMEPAVKKMVNDLFDCLKQRIEGK